MVDVLVAPSTDDLGGTQSAVQNALARPRPAAGISIAYRGSVAAMQKSFSSFGFGLSMAVVLLYLVMVAQFKSFLDPFIIMFAVPMGLIGVIWTLLLTGTTLNIESFMGIIVMVGIVVSNSILLVDFANQRFRGGEDLRRAMIESATNPHAPDSDDRPGDRGGPDADGAQARRGLGSFRAAGARRRRRTRSFDGADPLPGPRDLRNLLQPSSAGVEMNRYILPHNRSPSAC